jgi:hypothetical protein
MLMKRINFSSATQPINFQDSIALRWTRSRVRHTPLPVARR